MRVRRPSRIIKEWPHLTGARAAMVNFSVPKQRRWRVLGAVLVLLPLVLAAAFPWILGTRPVRRLLLARANRALAPGGLELTSIQFSWIGPTRISNFVLIDPRGDRVVVAPQARWDRNLWQILFERPRYGTLRLDRANLDIERRADGTIDLYEAIKPILRRDPKLDLQVLVSHGRLRFRSAGVPEPVTAEDTDFALHLAPAPDPLTWRLLLANAADTPRFASLEVQGRYQRWQEAPGGRHDLEVKVKGKQWPWSFEGSGVSASGTLHGDLAFGRRSGLWALSGDARLNRLDAAGPRLEGDHLRLEQVQGAWDVAASAEGWAVRRLDLESPLGSLRAKGALPASGDGESRIEGSLDLAALARQLPRVLRLREGITLERGSALVRIDAKTKQGRQYWDAEAKLSDLQARDRERAFTLHDPATLSARFVREENTLKFQQVGVETAFLRATGRGDLDRGFDWAGTLDLGSLQRQLHDLVEFGKLELAGRGDLTGRYHRTGDSYKATLAATLRDLRVGGILPGKLERDSLRLDVAWNGPATATGLPSAWNTLRAGVQTGGVKADVVAQARATATDLNLSVRAPVSLIGRGSQAWAKLAARWGEHEVAIEQMILALEPIGEEKANQPIRLAARGTFDQARNELVLMPLASGDASKSISLADNGLRVSGLGKAGALRAEGGFIGDVASLLKVIAPQAGDWGGTWTAHATAQSGEDGIQIGAKIAVRDLAAPSGRNEGPIGASLKALLRNDTDRLDLAELTLTSPYATLDVSGRLSDLGGRRLADLRGTLSPDWEAINTMLVERVEPRAHLEGHPRPLRLKGALTGDSLDDWLKGLDGEIGFDLKGAEFYGLRIGPAPVVLHSLEGKLAFDPIVTTINEGRLQRDPTRTFDDQDGAALRLGPESSIKDAAINDEVSHRVLSFVAPVLDQATRVHGNVSVALDEAVFPIGGNAGARATVEGKVQFQDVEFVPGPLAETLIGLIGRDQQPSLKLDEPIALAIADRRVQTRGLALPLGGVTRIELDGWVDFDRNLSMTASLPFTSALVGNVGILGDIIEGTKISVPIRGTLQHPEIDKQALKLGIEDLGKTLLDRTAGAGVGALLERLTRPRDPNAPPPAPRLTPEERRARRMERKAERRMRREGLIPSPPP